MGIRLGGGGAAERQLRILPQLPAPSPWRRGLSSLPTSLRPLRAEPGRVLARAVRESLFCPTSEHPAPSGASPRAVPRPLRSRNAPGSRVLQAFRNEWQIHKRMVQFLNPRISLRNFPVVFHSGFNIHFSTAIYGDSRYSTLPSNFDSLKF